MLARAKAALSVQVQAYKLANQGLFEGIVYSTPTDPAAVMQLAQLGTYSFNEETGDVKASWAIMYNKTGFEEFLCACADHQVKAKELKAAKERWDLESFITKELLHAKDATVSLYDDAYAQVDADSLACFLEPYGYKYLGAEAYEGSLEWDDPVSTLYRLKFARQ